MFEVPRARAPFRLLPTRAPRQTWLRASSWLAPSVGHRVLRHDGGEDTRCVKTISATQTNCVHPHLVVFPAPCTTFVVGIPHGFSGSVQVDRGTGGFHDLGTASADTHFDTVLVLYCLTAWRHERGRFLPTAPTCDRASDIPVTEPRSPSRLARLRERCIFAECPSLEGVIRVGGCDVGQDRRSRSFVKSAASFRSRMPSTGRDPS